MGVVPAKKVTCPAGPWSKLGVANVAVSVTIVPSGTLLLLEVTVSVVDVFVTVIAAVDELLMEKLMSPP